MATVGRERMHGLFFLFFYTYEPKTTFMTERNNMIMKFPCDSSLAAGQGLPKPLTRVRSPAIASVL